MNDDALRDILRSVDASDISSTQPLKEGRDDIVVTCASGSRHLVRLEGLHDSLLRQKWGYEQMRRAGLPCPVVEAHVEPCQEFPAGCLVLEWLEAVPASAALREHGDGPVTHEMCRELGALLRSLHDVTAYREVPAYIFDDRGGHGGLYDCLEQFVGHSVRDGLVDARFLDDARSLVDRYASRVPDPYPYKLHFTDMHFSNALVASVADPRAMGLIDIEEITVGWQMWDFTSWESWGLRFGNSWAREHILAGYGEVDMELYGVALLLRLAHPSTFVGTTREEITRAVESGDIGDFRLGNLYDL
ncbi:hypothetical protein CMK11_03430 [Candidatus Poribacteria bacterium]|nr:hypothetical protein [Candidatus Poribacteria bacterium]